VADSENDVWVLDTHTKGTGANMVPLERVLRRDSGQVPGFVLPERRSTEPATEAPQRPHRFKVVDLMTRRSLAEDVDARRAVKALRGARSIVDVIVYVWDGNADRWRRLTFAETKTLWELRA
jgi:hypothetical protein